MCSKEEVGVTSVNCMVNNSEVKIKNKKVKKRAEQSEWMKPSCESWGRNKTNAGSEANTQQNTTSKNWKGKREQGETAKLI